MKPFEGITFCPTGFTDEKKLTSISRIIIKLGGTFSRDLVRHTKVLILGGSIDTNKYKFAVKYRPDIIFIEMNIIEELYEIWKEGEDITFSKHSQYKHLNNNQSVRMLNVLKSRFSALPLHNVYFFIGRISSDHYSTDDLKAICQKLGSLKANADNFVKEISMLYPNNKILFLCDNLLSKRAQAATEKNIPIVHFKWLLDCKHRNAFLEYDPYYLVENNEGKSYHEIGEGACHCWEELPVISAYDIQESHDENKNSQETESTSKTLLLNKFKPKGDKLWKKAMSFNGDVDGDLAQGNSTAKTLVKKEMKYEPNGLVDNQLTKPNISRVNSTDMIGESNPIFENCCFNIHEMFPGKHHNILIKVIKKNGGTIATSSLIDPDYYVLPSNIPMNKMKIQKFHENTSLVTEFFIERCLHYKTLISPVDSWSKPFLFTNDFTVKPSSKLMHEKTEADNLQVTITGFQGVELLHLIKILNLLKDKGIQYNEYLNKSTDLLLINLSSLPSIPTTHSLWHNQYSDLFQLNLEKNKNDKQSVIFRNSLKNKIEFIKKNHSIPIITPAFIIDIFQMSQKLDREVTLIKSNINNVNWCIMCPQASNDDFSCKIIHAKGVEPQNSVNSSPSKQQHHSLSPRKQYKVEANMKNRSQYPTLAYSSKSSTVPNGVKGNSKEAINIIKDANKSHDLPQKRKRIASDITNYHDITKMSRNSLPMDTDISLVHGTEKAAYERSEIGTKRIRPLERNSSWGNMMTKVSNDAGIESQSETVDNKSQDDSEEVTHTQVVYGSSRNAKEIQQNNSNYTRRHTRRQTREIDL